VAGLATEEEGVVSMHSDHKLALAAFLAFPILGLATTSGGAECPAYVGARCSPARGDTLDCLFGLELRDPSHSPVPPTVRFTFKSDPAYKVVPSALELIAGSSIPVTVTLMRATQPLGLVELRGTAAGLPLDCAGITLPLDFSQPGAFRIEVKGTGITGMEAGKGLTQASRLVPGHEEQLEITLLDSGGQAVRGIPVPVTVVLNALEGSAEFVQAGRVSTEASLLLQIGDSSQLIMMRPLTAGAGRIAVEAKLDSSKRRLASTLVGFRCEHRWSRRLAYALLGGACFWLLRFVRLVIGAQRAALALGASLLMLGETLLASGVGFAVQDYLPQLGFSFRADPSRLDEQVILGLLLAGFGTEGLLGLLKQKPPRAATSGVTTDS
jgi:hypothetical protein